MNLLGSKKKGEVVYEHSSLSVLVALTFEDSCIVKDYIKKYKNKKNLPSEKINGFKFQVDQEFDSLKIDFSKTYEFLIRDLKLFPLK